MNNFDQSRSRSISLLASIVFLFCCGSNVSASDLLVGVNTHFGQLRGDINRTLEMSRQLGVNSIRDEVYWDGMECCTKGKLWVPRAWADWSATLDHARINGVQPLVILGFGNKFYGNGGFPLSAEARAGFLRYVETVAQRFKNKIAIYEVWNEWNIGAGGKTKQRYGDAIQYSKLLEQVYKKIKAIDPAAIVLGGSVAGMDLPWIDKFMRTGAIKFMDGLSIHPYNYCAPVADRTPENVLVALRKLNERMSSYAGGKEVPLYVTEMGWPTFQNKCGSDEVTVADYLSRFLLSVKTVPAVKGVWWYDFQNDGQDATNREHNFGLVTTNYAPKAAYYSLRDVSALATTGELLGRIASESRVWALRFRERSGITTVAAWNSDVASARYVLLKTTGGISANVAVKEVGAAGTGATRTLAKDGGKLFVALSSRPLLITGDFNSVDVSIVPTADPNYLLGLSGRSAPQTPKAPTLGR